MNLDRYDAFLLVIALMHLLILFQFAEYLRYDILQAASTGTSIIPIVTVFVFTVGVVFSLKGILKTIDVYFSDEAEKKANTKGLGRLVVVSIFLLVTMVIVGRSFSFY